MELPQEKIIWTIGHSTRSFDEFVAMLQSFNIQLLADIRNYPGSRRYPHFNKDVLEIGLPANNIKYIHLKDLGGRRKAVLNSPNTAWRNPAFRGYADYMETATFKQSANGLEEMAARQRTVIMCSEAVWWRCHRSLVADYLKFEGWRVMHIMGVGKEEEHPYTAPATILDGKLTYKENTLGF